MQIKKILGFIIFMYQFFLDKDLVLFRNFVKDTVQIILLSTKVLRKIWLIIF